LLYRQGYFSQTFDTEGNQHAAYADSEFESLPVSPVASSEGHELKVYVDLPGRRVACKVWQTKCGHVELYLLDTDIEENDEHGRDITHRLYGGDRQMRIEQEIILGVGGVRALDALKKRPTVWHINEGHAAFLLLERMRGLVAHGVDCATALECVAANTVFTTHTPVPAGHDHFSEEMIWNYFQNFCADLRMTREQFLDLGRVADEHGFNM